MRSLGICLLIAQAALLAGCSVYWKEPLGEADALDPTEWDGIWLTPEATFENIRVVDSKKGILGAKQACVADPREEYLQVNAAPRTLQESSNRWQFPLSVRRDAKGEFIPSGQPQALPSEPLFTYPLFALRTGSVWMWYPVAENRVKLLVEQGALPGQVERERTILGHLETQHYDVLSSVERPVVHWERGQAHVRLSPGIDPCTKKEPNNLTPQ